MSTFYGLTVETTPLLRDLLGQGRLVDEGVLAPASRPLYVLRES